MKSLGVKVGLKEEWKRTTFDGLPEFYGLNRFTFKKKWQEDRCIDIQNSDLSSEEDEANLILQTYMQKPWGKEDELKSLKTSRDSILKMVNVADRFLVHLRWISAIWDLKRVVCISWAVDAAFRMNQVSMCISPSLGNRSKAGKWIIIRISRVGRKRFEKCRSDDRIGPEWIRDVAWVETMSTHRLISNHDLDQIVWRWAHFINRSVIFILVIFIVIFNAESLSRVVFLVEALLINCRWCKYSPD